MDVKGTKMSPNSKSNHDMTTYLVKLLGDYFNSSSAITLNDVLKVIINFNSSMAATIVGADTKNGYKTTQEIISSDKYAHFMEYIALTLLDKIGKMPSSTETIQANNARTQ